MQSERMLYLVTEYASSGEIFGTCIDNVDNYRIMNAVECIAVIVCSFLQFLSKQRNFI